MERAGAGNGRLSLAPNTQHTPTFQGCVEEVFISVVCLLLRWHASLKCEALLKVWAEQRILRSSGATLRHSTRTSRTALCGQGSTAPFDDCNIRLGSGLRPVATERLPRTYPAPASVSASASASASSPA